MIKTKNPKRFVYYPQYKTWEFRYNIWTNQHEGYEWEVYDSFCWHFAWCIPGYEHHYYDGDIHCFKLGIGILNKYWGWGDRREINE